MWLLWLALLPISLFLLCVYSHFATCSCHSTLLTAAVVVVTRIRNEPEVFLAAYRISRQKEKKVMLFAVFAF